MGISVLCVTHLVQPGYEMPLTWVTSMSCTQLLQKHRILFFCRFCHRKNNNKNTDI